MTGQSPITRERSNSIRVPLMTTATGPPRDKSKRIGREPWLTMRDPLRSNLTPSLTPTAALCGESWESLSARWLITAALSNSTRAGLTPMRSGAHVSASRPRRGSAARLRPIPHTRSSVEAFAGTAHSGSEAPNSVEVNRAVLRPCNSLDFCRCLQILTTSSASLCFCSTTSKATETDPTNGTTKPGKHPVTLDRASQYLVSARFEEPIPTTCQRRRSDSGAAVDRKGNA